jgi:hypothetical protein
VLAARATANLAQTPHVRVVHGDGTRIAFEPAVVIYVNGGAMRPADIPRAHPRRPRPHALSLGGDDLLAGKRAGR